MKKFIVVITVLLLVASLMAGCQKEQPKPASKEETPDTTVEEPVIRIGGLKGPTSMGLVKLLEDNEAGNSLNKYEFSIYGAADELTPKIMNGELDIAAVPANLAAVLYNNTKGKVKLLAVNTLGVIYIVENGDTVTSLADLKGRSIYATGKGATPEYALNYILKENGIDVEKDLTIEWKTEPTEVVAVMKNEPGSIAMMPQPYVTVAQSAIPNLRTAVDLTKEWDALDNGSMLITGVLIVRTEFAESHPSLIDKFLEEYEASTRYVNANVDEASIMIEKYDIVKAAIAKKALPYCNIAFYAGDEMKTAMSGYLQVLYDQNPKSVGEHLPDDAFYYGSK